MWNECVLKQRCFFGVLLARTLFSFKLFCWQTFRFRGKGGSPKSAARFAARWKQDLEAATTVCLWVFWGLVGAQVRRKQLLLAQTRSSSHDVWRSSKVGTRCRNWTSLEIVFCLVRIQWTPWSLLRLVGVRPQTRYVSWFGASPIPHTGRWLKGICAEPSRWAPGGFRLDVTFLDCLPQLCHTWKQKRNSMKNKRKQGSIEIKKKNGKTQK